MAAKEFEKAAFKKNIQDNCKMLLERGYVRRMISRNFRL